VWNLHEPIPAGPTAALFDRVVFLATMEHLVDPAGVLRKLVGLLADGGKLYLHTLTPLFPYHGWPKDFLRFFPDWFRDIGFVIPEIEVVTRLPPLENELCRHWQRS
jgi:SAM-dependent methyltransferase